MGSAQGRRRTQKDSRLATALRATVFFALVAGVVIASKPLWGGHAGQSKSTAKSAAGATQTSTSAQKTLFVRYRSGTTGSSTSSVQPWLQIVNVSQQNVDLSKVTLRYYFKQNGSQAYAANCIYAAFGCSQVTEHVVALPTAATGADHYLEVSFAEGAGVLKPAANSGAIELQLYEPGGGSIAQSADYSYNGAQATSYRPNTHVAAYIGGTLVWGVVPSGSSAQAPSASTQAVAAGTYFDDFHYSGADDPALSKHGWVVRTSSGGPGVLSTWKASGVTFPAASGADGGEVLDLSATTDGTKSGTTQSEIDSLNVPFFTGTYAARIHFTDSPTSGTNGDPINEDFYMISPRNANYSELDAEYQPNGGWGAPGPRLDTTSWYSVYNCNNVTTSQSVVGCDRETKENTISLNGWHTLVITAVNGVVTYSIDGNVLFTTSGKYYPRESMSADFNSWFVDLKEPISGTRKWDTQVNWFYYNSQQSMSLAQVQQTVSNLYASGTNFVDTMSTK
ncbi:hypothetical protein KDK95_05540 [Actinospica sp. MGRD01-02]|uniref:CBM3 domain-containing protein n=1 Tax=Actinospica acidithermotolerans TaxID=2828514 RepID=A0A941IHI6_9ACTN|nr:cellulose binding domain-containing protein [Actinospica acidithermotolerans]MBR7825762.1 hypothetical protein [Actinospica acidithermotolerans]